jgi:tRNA pseudouridine(38-40) synthase
MSTKKDDAVHVTPTPATASDNLLDSSDINDATSKRKTKTKSPYEYSHKKRKQQKQVKQGAQKNEKKKHFRRKTCDDSLKDIPNKGSYADPEMRKLYGVSVHRTATTAGAASSDDSKRPKRKVALLIGYVGESYAGFQINPGVKSIQAQIELALYEAGFLSDLNFGFPHKYGWSNSARTDKGVHACAQVCSVKLLIHTPDDTDWQVEATEAINEKLPGDIRILDIVRTTRNFCARVSRDRGRYMYLIPSFLFYERNKLRKLFESKGCLQSLEGKLTDEPLSEEQIQLLVPEFNKYRATPENTKRLKEALKAYVGTHHFHNFTSRITSSDPQSQRYIISFDVLDPVVGEDGMEWIPTLVLGQSFVLNQIRKMVSLAVDAARGAADANVIMKALDKDERMNINLAPAQGLYLEMSYFTLYNERKNPDDPLDWTSKETPASKRHQDFKETKIIKHIMNEEAKKSNFLRYLWTQEFAFDKTRYEGAKKVI